MFKKIFIFNEFANYFLASLLSLIFDFFIYWTLANKFQLRLSYAAAFGYIMGLMVAYYLISKYIFTNGWLNNNKMKEYLLFLFSGFVGVIITFMSVELYVMTFEDNLYTAKLFATGFSFIIVFLFRKFIVFKTR